MSRLSDLNGLSSSTQHKVRRPLGNIIIQTLSMLMVILIKKIKRYQSIEICKKRHQFDVIPAIIFFAKNI